MNDIVLYSNQTVLAAGLRVTVAGMQGFHLVAVSTTIAELLVQVHATPPALILIDLTSEVSLERLKKIQSEARGAGIILWVDAVSTEFVSQVISVGVRGILRKTIAIELHLKCLQKVAAGELWLEKPLSDRLLTTKRLFLTLRERQLLGLLAQGLKNKEIAYSLGITEGTVKVYLSHLFRKVGATDRLDLALFALRNIYGLGGSEHALAGSVESSPAAPVFMPGFLTRPAA